MKAWQAIRAARDDLTDHVIHLTRTGNNGTPLETLLQILHSGIIKPSFGEKRLAGRSATSITVKGPHPAVCFTEQTIAAIVKTLPIVGSRYRGYGVAYYKSTLHRFGGRPVLYGTSNIFGRQTREGEPGWQEGKEIFAGGLPADLQYLFVRYAPQLMETVFLAAIGPGNESGESEAMDGLRPAHDRYNGLGVSRLTEGTMER